MVVVTNTQRAQVVLGPRLDLGKDGVVSARFAPGKNEVSPAYWDAAKKTPTIARELEVGHLVEGEPEPPARPGRKPAAPPAKVQLPKATQVGQAARDAARGKAPPGDEG
jgi:hypothetical protein